MGEYLQEPVPPTVISTMLNTYWDEKQGEVPMPYVIDLNVDKESAVNRHEFRTSDLILIRTDTGGERETLRGDYDKWRDVTFDVSLELYTAKSRQRLYDMKQVIRQIFHTYMFTSSVTGFQLLRYMGFIEKTQENLRVWSGEVRVRFESAAISTDTLS